MTTDVYEYSSRLAAQVEIAIRRNQSENLDRLSKLQRHLVRVGSAPSPAAAREQLSEAYHLFQTEVPDWERQNRLVELTSEFQELAPELSTRNLSHL